ncbi:MAG TPA: C69 family dipeptidase [bacterium]|nr:C69 family dipeptidase [bacterium]HPR86735.1 C69 family dipeptidase [bacterium]
MKISPWLLCTALILGTAFPSPACTIIAAGKKATADGSVILSHTDTGPDSRLRVVPGRSFPAGALAPVYWGIQDPAQSLDHPAEILGYIPQVPQTFTYIRSAYSHINAHQLGIAESTISQRPELVNEKGKCEQIMTIEMAQIFALERCGSARAAVRLIGDLMTTWGFLCSAGDGGEALCIGDTAEVWVFEVIGVGPDWKKASGQPGAIWAAARLGDDQATMIPNWSIIKEIDPADTQRFMVSANYQSAAVERGWYDPAAGKPFIWQEVYTPLPQEYATGRFWLFYSTFAPNLYPWPDRSMGSDPFKNLNPYMQYVEPLSIYPFSARPEHKISVREVIAFQRSVFEGTIYDMTNDPNWLVPDGKGGYSKSPLATPFPGRDLRALLRLTNRRPVARHRGHYGMVLQLRGWLPDPIGGLYWVYLDNPYFSPYVPIYAGVTGTAASYQIYDPEKYSDASARWTIDMVDNLAGLCFQRAIEDVRAVRDPWEAANFARQDSIETAAVQLYAKSPKKAAEFLTRYCVDLQEQVPGMYIGLRNTLITRYTNNRE